MKVLIIVSTILAAAAAGFIYPDQTSFGHYASVYSDHYGHHEVTIGPHGVPLETPEVAAARAVHLAAHAEERARHLGYAYGHGVYTPQGPIDTPEVQIAKFKHLAAHAEAKHRSTHSHLSAPLETPEVQIARYEHMVAHAKARQMQHSAPVDTIAVQQAKVAHFAAVAEAQSHHDQHDVYQQSYEPTYARHTGYAYGHGVYTPQGPIDTPEVQIAKLKHLAAHAEAKHRSAHSHLSAPMETPEVQIARHEHLAAYAKVLHHHAAPVDTVAVQQAKVAHFAAVAEAQAHHDQHHDSYQHSYEPTYDHGYEHDYSHVAPVVYQQHGW